MSKIENYYKGEIYKVMLTTLVEDDGDEITDRMVVGVNKFDVFNLQRAYAATQWSAEDLGSTPQEYENWLDEEGRKENTVYVNTPKLIEWEFEHEGHGQTVQASAKIMSVNFGHNISKDDMEAIVNL